MMGENTKIAWATHTFNPWTGCTKVSPGCHHCYAEGWAKRSGLVEWGRGKPRRRTSEANWRKPLKWDRDAAKAGTRPRVFCASLADVFDDEVDSTWRHDLWRLIENTPNLEWLLLTKRPQNWSSLMPSVMTPVPNVRLGVTIENQKAADIRMPYLQVFGYWWKTFVSYEPAIGRVDWWPWLDPKGPASNTIGWMICGCESGHVRRRFDAEWALNLRDLCRAADVPFFYKQGPGGPPPKGVIERPFLDGRQHLEFPNMEEST